MGGVRPLLRNGLAELQERSREPAHAGLLTALSGSARRFSRGAVRG